MKFILGTKTGMTQVFDNAGICQAATVLKVTPATVSQVRTVEKDGYAAVQVASGTQKENRVAKAQMAHFGGAIAVAKEFRPRQGEEAQIAGLEKGATISVATFAPGDTITVTAVSKGKGFQGVVKRHGFKGGRRSHGQKHSEREPGSIGGGGRAGGRVAKGMRMAGRMGGDTVTVKNLTVLQVNEKENLLIVAGAVPGRKGTLVEVYGA
jgi:large subunit ribosomal protein L3